MDYIKVNKIEELSNKILSKITHNKLPYDKNIFDIDIKTHFDHTRFEPEKTLKYVVGIVEHSEYPSDRIHALFDNLGKLFIEHNNIQGLLAVRAMFSYYAIDDTHYYKVYHAAQYANLETVKYVLDCFGNSYCYERPTEEIKVDDLIELAKKNPNTNVYDFL